MVVTTPSTIMPPPTCDNYKAKQCLWAYLIPPWTWPLTFWPQNLTHSSLPQNLLVVTVWSNSVNKYPRYIANKVRSGFMHAWTHEHTKTQET